MTGLMNEEHDFLYDYGGLIPQTVTLSSYTSAHELLRTSSDDLTKVMVNDILPDCVTPKINIKELYEPDYLLMLRHLRMLTWGPFYTPGHYICSNCTNENGGKGVVEKWNGTVNLAEVPVVRPDDDKELITTHEITRDKFLFLDKNVKLHINKAKDLLLRSTKVKPDRKKLIPIASAIASVDGMDFVDIREVVDWLADEVSPADTQIMQDEYTSAFKFGMTTHCDITCPKCGGAAWCFVPVDDNYFRPTRENLREWKELLGKSKGKVRSDKQ